MSTIATTNETSNVTSLPSTSKAQTAKESSPEATCMSERTEHVLRTSIQLLRRKRAWLTDRSSVGSLSILWTLSASDWICDSATLLSRMIAAS